MGVQNGNGEGPAAGFGESHGEAGEPAGFRRSLAQQIPRRVRGEPALMFPALRSGPRALLSPVAVLRWVRFTISHVCFYVRTYDFASSSATSPRPWM